MARFTAPQAPNCSPNAAYWAVVAQVKLKSRGDIVYQLALSFTQSARFGAAGNMTKREHWQIATAIRCSLRWKMKSKHWRFRQSVAALTVIQSRKPHTLHSKRCANFSR